MKESSGVTDDIERNEGKEMGEEGFRSMETGDNTHPILMSHRVVIQSTNGLYYHFWCFLRWVIRIENSQNRTWDPVGIIDNIEAMMTFLQGTRSREKLLQLSVTEMSDGIGIPLCASG
jgi:hypothetical protein